MIGHDFGSPVAAWCALVRPDIFRAVALMSAPFGGPPALPEAAEENRSAADIDADTDAALAALDRPRKHYVSYYATRAADADMRFCKQGIHDFLRAYYHVKSAGWTANRPHPLAVWSAGELAKLPSYYVMDRDKTMAETVAPEMPSPESIAACRWLTDDELRIYSGEFARTGFQGGLQWYRCRTLAKSDWGPYQRSGDPEQILRKACTQFRGFHLVEGAGHWVQQEQPAAVSAALMEFLREAASAPVSSSRRI